MADETVKEIVFDEDDFALMRRAMRHLLDHFDDMTPAFRSATGYDRHFRSQAIIN